VEYEKRQNQIARNTGNSLLTISAKPDSFQAGGGLLPSLMDFRQLVEPRRRHGRKVDHDPCTINQRMSVDETHAAGEPRDRVGDCECSINERVFSNFLIAKLGSD
jgi:hypothetical protein